MIFVSVGTQLPFPRLINLTLKGLNLSNSKYNLLCQTADEVFSPDSPVPDNCTFQPFIAANEFVANIIKADLVISHAGMGNILSCLEYGKTGIFLARSFELGEHRNDHQFDTAKSFQDKFPNIHLFTDGTSFTDYLVSRLKQPMDETNNLTIRGGPAISTEMKYFQRKIRELMEAL